MLMEQFKAFQKGRLNLDEVVELSAYGRGLQSEYTALGMEVPAWVSVQLKTIQREVKTRIADQAEAELLQAKAQLDSLKTAGERKEALQARIAALEAKLGVETNTPATV